MTTWEGGTRVPFCVQWKGKLPAGKTYENPIIQLDILPTALAAAGVEIKPEWNLDGVNLLPYLTGEKTEQPHETLYWRFGDQWAVRHGDWKLVAGNGGDLKNGDLYNLADDVGESKNLRRRHAGKGQGTQVSVGQVECRAGARFVSKGKTGGDRTGQKAKQGQAKEQTAKRRSASCQELTRSQDFCTTSVLSNI